MIAEQELATTCTRVQGQARRSRRHGPQDRRRPGAGATGRRSTRRTSKTPSPNVRRNRCLTDPYEPGSTIKPFIAGPALRLAHHARRRGLADPRHHLQIAATAEAHHRRPRLRPAGDVGRAGEVEQHRHVDARRAHGQPEALQALTRAFQFGRPTGIELPGEDPGASTRSKSGTSTATESVAQGYEMMVTPLQLARAFCAYANGGQLVQPRSSRACSTPTAKSSPAHKPADAGIDARR